MIHELLILWDEYLLWAEYNPIFSSIVEKYGLGGEKQRVKDVYGSRPHTMEDFMKWLRKRGE